MPDRERACAGSRFNRAPGKPLLYTLWLWISILYSSTGVSAAPPPRFPDRWLVESLTQEQGLPQNSITGIHFDKYGFLWVSTQNGLARFDGKQFKTFNTGRQAQGLSSRMFGIFTRTNTDTLYALDDMLNVYSITEGKVYYSGKYSKKKYGTFLFNTRQEISNAHFFQYKNYDRELGWEHFKCVGCASTGFYLNADTSALLISGGLGLFTRKGLVGTIPFKGLLSYEIVKTGNGFTYIDQKQQRVRLYAVNGTFTDAPLPFNNGKPWHTLENLAKDGCSYIYNEQYLYEVQSKGGQALLKPVLDNFRYESSATFIYKKSDHCIISASEINGISVYKKAIFMTINPTEYPAGTEKDNSFYAQVLLPDNKTILTGSNKRIDRDGFKGLLPGFDNACKTTILRDRRNTYWYNHQEKSVIGGKLYNSRMDGSPPKAYHDLNYINLRCLYEDREGDIWVISQYGMGYYTHTDHRFVPVFNKGLDFIMTDKVVVQYVAEDNNTTLILATTKGIYIYDKKKPEARLRLLALEGVNIRFLMVDQATNDIWATSYGDGLFFVSGNDGKTVRFPLDKDLNLGTTHGIMEDKRHRFWMPTNNGLYVTTRAALLHYIKDRQSVPLYNRYSLPDGLVTNEFNGGCMPAYLTLPDGTLSLPTIKGLVWFKPDSVEIRFSPDNMLLDRIMANNRELQIQHDNKLVLKEETAKNISFEMASSSFTYDNSGPLEYALEEEGDHNDWHPLHDQGKLDIPYLKAHTYTLTFRKRTGTGNNDFVYRRYTIKVTPLWYKTMPFYTGLGVIVLLLSWLAFYMRVRTIARRNAALKERIADATTQLSTQNATLKSTNDVKDKLMSLFNHDISIPIFYIGRALQRLSLDKELTGNNRSKIRAIASTANELQLLTDDLLVWIQLQQDNDEVDITKEDVDIREVFGQKIMMFTARMAEKNIRTRSAIPPGLTIHTDRRIFGIILYNLLANSVKHLYGGTIVITAHAKDEHGPLRIILSDIPDEEISDPIGSAANTMPPRGSVKDDELSHGIGLRLINDLARLLDLRIRYNFGNGHSRVSITTQD